MLKPFPYLPAIVKLYTIDLPENNMQLLLNPSALPEIIKLIQKRDEEGLRIIFYITRTYCAALHKAKMKLLGIM